MIAFNNITGNSFKENLANCPEAGTFAFNRTCHASPRCTLWQVFAFYNPGKAGGGS
jgi:hypothetical protein